MSAFRPLELRLWRLTERVSARLKDNELAGATVTLKLKTADFRIRTRARSLEPPDPARRDASSPPARDLLEREIDGTKFRLIGIGVSPLIDADDADLADLLDHRTAEAEHAIDRLRASSATRPCSEASRSIEDRGRRLICNGRRAAPVQTTRQAYLQGLLSWISSVVSSPLITKSL